MAVDVRDRDSERFGSASAVTKHPCFRNLSPGETNEARIKTLYPVPFTRRPQRSLPTFDMLEKYERVSFGGVAPSVPSVQVPWTLTDRLALPGAASGVRSNLIAKGE